MREGNPLKLTGIPQRKPQENDAIPKIAPKWLKYDKQVSLSKVPICGGLGAITFGIWSLIIYYILCFLFSNIIGPPI